MATLSEKEKEKELLKSGINVKRRNLREAYLQIDLNELDEEYIREIKKYYKSIGLGDVDIGMHMLYQQKLGVKSKYFIPGNLINKVIAFVNEEGMMNAYTDKNMYGLMVKSEKQPENHVRRVRGSYFDSAGDSIAQQNINNELKENMDYIIKPSRTANGESIGLLQVKNGQYILSGESLTLQQLEKVYGNDFLIQGKIDQHPSISRMHSESVNTLRMLTFRWKGEIRHLMTFLRIGCYGSINDNAGSGGICVGVKEDGSLNSYAVNKKGQILDKHPSSGFSFEEESTTIEKFEAFKNFVINLHKDIPHHDLVSWDIVVDKNGDPLFIEHNFKGALWLYQLACGKPLFGEISSEVLSHIGHNFNSRVPTPNKKPILERTKIAVKTMLGR